MPTEQYLLRLDPGGTPPLRDTGIDLIFRPTEAPELTYSATEDLGRTFVGQATIATTEPRFSFTADAWLSAAEKQNLQALIQWQQALKGQYEVVVYWLWDQVSALSQVRLAVPGTTVTTATVGNSTQYTYFPALQGFLDAEFQYLGPDCYSTRLTFSEGTIIPPS